MTECQINRLKIDNCHYSCLYSWCIFKRRHRENFRTYYTNLIWDFSSKRKRYHTFWDQDQFEVFKEFIKNWISTFCWSLETDCTFLHHWSYLSLSTLYLFLLTFLICCIEVLVLVDFCINLSSVLKLLLSSWITGV